MFQHEDARRVVRAHGAHRRVLRPGAHDRARPPRHPHNVARKTFVEVGGIVAAGAGARASSRTAGEIARPAGAPRPAHREVLVRLGHARATEIDEAAREPARSIGARLMAHARLLPRPSRRRVDHDRRHDGQGAGGGPPGGARRRDQRRARRGRPTTCAAGETLGRRRRARDRAVGRGARRHRVSSGSATATRDDGWEQNDEPDVVLAGADVDEAAARLAGDPARGARRRADGLRLARQLRPSRPHPGAPRRPSRPPSWRARRASTRRR